MELIFGGTSEGRELYSWMRSRGRKVLLSVATEYGREVVGTEDSILIGRLNSEQMVSLITERGITRVIDATHPFAVEVSRNIREACEECSIPCLRLLRGGGEATDGWICQNTQEAVELLKTLPGNVLLTTGSKELHFYGEIPDFAERFYGRVLPAEESLRLCHEAGLPGSHILAMQGPFSEEWDRLLLRTWNISIMVTKASGSRGGFEEKIAAAKKEGVRVLVIDRPVENGFSYEEIIRILEEKPE